VSAHHPAYFTIIGLAAGACTTLSFVPQLLKTIRTRRTQDMSGLWLTCFICGVSLWLIYGLLLPSMPIILTNAATLLLTLPILFFKIVQASAQR
jgi:MtN3 and saliva related transmembrane protein